ncbi:L-fuculose-phosphate aldolase [Desulfofundulus australicus DSM 11792]|jgi:L-fuculose-phosphate aldolase|uniref:L-fuculose-phosphate aldolase n=1 Tax=Desulfofundulus australicus DSM 11792 TaxID=1121425 RepID=A0A1M4U9I0_9FIRM|nr:MULTISPECIES: class II aldolase/adducin family protein [Desulfofundulus]SHE53213.1 L-fuculose-phosphate aldolase [Desulfofundulus australicus DSM 11792]
MTVAVEKYKEQVYKMSLRMATSGLVTGSWGNISARVPREELVVITPSGIPYANLQARDMVVLDLDGRVVEGEKRPSTEFMLHLAIYHARPDVYAVMHTHSVFASALAVARKPIPPILEDLAQTVGNGVAVASYARAGTEELARAAVEALGDRGAVLLANHGVVGVGRNLEEAFMVCQIVEKSAKVYVWADLVGQPAILPAEEVEALRSSYLQGYSLAMVRNFSLNERQ